MMSRQIGHHLRQSRLLLVGRVDGGGASHHCPVERGGGGGGKVITEY